MERRLLWAPSGSSAGGRDTLFGHTMPDASKAPVVRQAFVTVPSASRQALILYLWMTATHTRRLALSLVSPGCSTSLGLA